MPSPKERHINQKTFIGQQYYIIKALWTHLQYSSRHTSWFASIS
ncbi:hypothetical protein GCWU000325_01157 [Alloprevotella tannerae ATCC 51259]|uniref:Uncharacterized protein n=1 Tax=Alloprevotella tannerae ATCC 51259 TaxID=626522 RepID=C9LG17_9BACT|nr:hypothetical protein GCWU000325_01157 [Alloprevotella tannerae ATCC 51259]